MRHSSFSEVMKLLVPFMLIEQENIGRNILSHGHRQKPVSSMRVDRAVSAVIEAITVVFLAN